MKIIETTSPREDAGKALSALLEDNKNKPILLMLSGGSAFSILDFIPVTVIGPHVTVTVLDERYSTDPQVNNFAQLEQTNFYKTCIAQGADYISTKLLEGESMEILRDRFNLALHTWKGQNKNGVIIATMGIGVDGHTAGIFPGEHGVNFNDDAWVVGYSVSKEKSEYVDRVTVTYTFLREQINSAVVYSVGHDKYRLVQRLQSTNYSTQEIPALIFKDVPILTIFTTI